MKMPTERRKFVFAYMESAIPTCSADRPAVGGELNRANPPFVPLQRRDNPRFERIPDEALAVVITGEEKSSALRKAERRTHHRCRWYEF